MRHFNGRLFSLFLAALAPAPLAAETMAEMFPGYADWLDPSLQGPFGKLEIHHGTVPIPGDVYSLDLGEQYYALTGADAAWVYQTIWENLPEPGLDALIFKTGTSPLDGSWAVTVITASFGHISDDEAATMDYQAIVDDQIAAEPEVNRQRRESGLPELTTIGLAGTPGYDTAAHALRYSVLLRSSGYDGEILNANAWVLSRHGFVQLTVLGDAAHAYAVDVAMPDLIKLVQLKDGSRYGDFIPGVDTVAEGGLSALIGGGAAQVGLIAVAIALLKKFGVLLLVPFYWVFRHLSGRDARS